MMLLVLFDGFRSIFKAGIRVSIEGSSGVFADILKFKSSVVISGLGLFIRDPVRVHSPDFLSQNEVFWTLCAIIERILPVVGVIRVCLLLFKLKQILVLGDVV